MLESQIDWQLLRDEFEEKESDWMAIIRSGNCVHLVPIVFYNGESYIKEHGRRVALNNVNGYAGYEHRIPKYRVEGKMPTQSFFEPLSGRTWEVPKYT
jgi:hypothetical protein